MCVYTELLEVYEVRNDRRRRRRERMKEAIAILIFAVIGGSLRKIREADKKLTWASYAVSVVSSFFLGMIVLLILRHFGTSLYLQGALAGIAGYCADSLLDVATPIIIRAVCKKLNIEPPDRPHRRKDDPHDPT